MTTDLTLSARIAAELRHRAARRREALARLHATFPETLGALPDEPPIEPAVRITGTSRATTWRTTRCAQPVSDTWRSRAGEGEFILPSATSERVPKMTFSLAHFRGS